MQNANKRPLVADEVAVSAMALSCARDAVPEAGVAMNRAVAFLRGLRRNDGSYGSIYTTSLVLQVQFTFREQLL